MWSLQERLEEKERKREINKGSMMTIGNIWRTITYIDNDPKGINAEQ